MPAPLLAAGMGTLGGIVSSAMQGSATRAAARAQLQGIREGIEERRQAGQDVLGYVDPYRQAGTRALGDLESMQASVAPPEQFDMGAYGVEKYLDPSMQYQQDQARRQLEASAAAGGPGLRSGAFANQLQQNAERFAQTDWGNAFGRAQQDRAANYQDYIQRYTMQRQQVQDELARTKDLLSTGFAGTQLAANARTGTSQDLANLFGQQGAVQGAGAASYGLQGAGMVQAATDPTLWSSLGGLGGGQPAQEPAPSAPQPTSGNWGNTVDYGQSVDPNAPGNRQGNLGGNW
jgi:hypothetical protein